MASTPSSTERVTAHSIARDFTAAVEQGTAVDAAAVKALQACQAAGVQPSASLYNRELPRMARTPSSRTFQHTASARVGMRMLWPHTAFACFRSADVLASHSAAGPPEAVLSWFAKMKTAVSIDIIACNMVLKAHVARNDLPAAAAMLTTMMRSPSQRDGLPMPDVVSFNTVINGLAQAKQPVKAEALLIAMIDFGLVTPTSGTYASVVAAFARASNPASAEKWLQRMLETTSPTTDAASEVVGFNAALLAYSNAQDAAGALRVLEAFESRATDECPNAKPDVISYNTAMSACARGDQPANAEKIFHQMVKKGITPNQISFSTVIHAHAHAGASIKAQKWLDRMRAEGVAPDAISYNSVCAAHAKRGDVPSALACFNAMSADGVSPSPQTHAIMINALVQSGNAEQAEASLRVLLQSGERLEAAAFNALISLHGKNGEPFRAEAVLILMQEGRIRPTLVTFNSLASAHATCGDCDATERILAQAAAPPYNFRLDRYSYGALLQSVARERENSKSARGASSAAAKTEQQRIERAKTYIKQLWSSGVEMNDYLSGACSRALGTQRAVEQLRKEFSASSSSSSSLSSRGRASAALASSHVSSSDGPWRRVTRSKSPSSARPTAASSAPVTGDEEMAAAESAEESEAEEEEDGWTTVGSGGRSGGKGKGKATRSRRTSSESVGGSGGGGKKALSAANKTIGKKNPASTSPGLGARRLTRNTSSEGLTIGGMGPGASPSGARPAAGSPDMVRGLVGVPLTRSRSERARLLALAKDVMADGGAAGGAGPAVATADTAMLPPSLPLQRSAASQLALDLGEGMAF